MQLLRILLVLCVILSGTPRDEDAVSRYTGELKYRVSVHIPIKRIKKLVLLCKC